MPKKTLALISGLVIVTIILFIIALRAGQQQQAPNTPPAQPLVQTKPMVPAHTVLKLLPNPLTVAAGQQGTVRVRMNTNNNHVTAVQLELGYDPNIISNVTVVPGPMFHNAVILINKNNPANGRYTYAFGITPGEQPVSGVGPAAIITFTTVAGTTGKVTQLGLLPTSLVTARGVAASVLKSTVGTIITVGPQRAGL